MKTRTDCEVTLYFNDAFGEPRPLTLLALVVTYSSYRTVVRPCTDMLSSYLYRYLIFLSPDVCAGLAQGPSFAEIYGSPNVLGSIVRKDQSLLQITIHTIKFRTLSAYHGIRNSERSVERGRGSRWHPTQLEHLPQFTDGNKSSSTLSLTPRG